MSAWNRREKIKERCMTGLTTNRWNDFFLHKGSIRHPTNVSQLDITEVQKISSIFSQIVSIHWNVRYGYIIRCRESFPKLQKGVVELQIKFTIEIYLVKEWNRITFSNKYNSYMFDDCTNCDNSIDLEPLLVCLVEVMLMTLLSGYCNLVSSF